MAYARLVVSEKAGGVEEALREHAAVLGRVCMALVGDRDGAEKALERVAREAAGKSDGAPTKASLLGLARTACATQLSKIPMTRREAGPTTARMGAAQDAGFARASLGKLKPTEREAVVLHLVGGLDAADVARACGTDEQTARARIARGLLLLAEDK
jgi:DNA-directed RNA polymerase specialized sigma24 family protein